MIDINFYSRYYEVYEGWKIYKSRVSKYLTFHCTIAGEVVRSCGRMYEEKVVFLAIHNISEKSSHVVGVFGMVEKFCMTIEKKD
jgi:hypothetical protein